MTSRKDQRQLDKRDIYLVDKSGVEITFTLWNELASDFNIQPGTVIGVKGAMVREFNGWNLIKYLKMNSKNDLLLGGISISSGMNTQIVENPEGEYTQQLYLWNRDQKPNQEIKTLSSSIDSAAVFGQEIFFKGRIYAYFFMPLTRKIISRGRG